MVSDFEARSRNVTAVLGPTNTGKTHLAIERMLGHQSGLIGLPLRLLAREVYDKVKARVGVDHVALITGEEKIKPANPKYWISTVEAMPRDIDVEFLAIDEVQLCADPERGHVFTDRLLHARGRSETLLLGAQTMRDAIADLIPGANFIARPRLSKLTYSGQKKITRLPSRTAIVAFSTQEVYEIAELIRRQRGGAAVVLGALSPRTRNAQVELYQSGDVEFLVATDAIGMGLNLDVDHVAFSALRKFDGYNHRNLTPNELAQIAGRAGRHLNDGTFGVTGAAEPLEADLVERLEDHAFDSVKVLQWRNRTLNFSSVDSLLGSLRTMPATARLVRARMAEDLAALEAAVTDPDVVALAQSPDAVSLLWDACQVPDYRNISNQSHAELVCALYKFVAKKGGRIPEDWFAKQVALADRTDGDIDTLATRIAHIRTWTFVANRPDWLNDPAHWQDKTRAIEDSLSDALHERLTQRFVDRRTSALMKGMRDKDELSAEISEDGSISVEDHFVGRLNGLRFTVDTTAQDVHGRATRQAATQVVARELGMRVRRVTAANDDAFKLTRQGVVQWRDEDIATLEASEDPLLPSINVLADENLAVADRDRVQERLGTWLKGHVADKLKPLVDLSNAVDLQGLSRGIAFQLKENFGVLKRERVAEDISALDQPARAELRKFGLRFGAFNIFFPVLLKPASAELATTLWLLKNGEAKPGGLAETCVLPRPGLTSAPADPATPEDLYRVNGFHLCGPRVVRLDILERLADLIRPLLSWRAKPDDPTPPPKGATGEGAFKATDDMMSILGCSAAELGAVLTALGFRVERRRLPSLPGAVAETTNTVEVEPEPEAAAGTDPAANPATPVAAEPSAPGSEQVAEHAVPPACDGVASEQGDLAAAPVVEEQFEELWRPNRHRSADRRPRGAPRHGQGSGRRGNEGPSASPSAAANASPAGAHQAKRGREDDGGRGGPRHGGKPKRGGKSGRSNGGGRRPQHRDDNAQRPAAVSSAGPKRGGADPDSPFAALAALKASLDKGDGN